MVYNVIRGSEFMCGDVSFGTGFEIFGRMCRLIVCWSAEMCCCGLDGMFTFVFCVTHSNDQTRQTCTDLNTGVVRKRQRFFLGAPRLGHEGVATGAYNYYREQYNRF